MTLPPGYPPLGSSFERHGTVYTRVENLSEPTYNGYTAGIPAQGAHNGHRFILAVLNPETPENPT